MGFTLNPHQQQAVDATGHCVVSACPGSGKTRVLSERAARLLDGDKSKRLCAVTFTRDAASQLRERIIKTCSTTPSKRLATGTFHSLALSQLRKDRGRRLRVIGAAEQNLLLRKAWEKHGQLLSFEDVQSATDVMRSGGNMLDASEDGIAGEVLRAYLKLLRNMNAVDFQEILRETVRCIIDGTLSPLPISWMLVDEAQDMDGIQYAWVRAHADAGIHVTIVGDDDQSIYGWRHALGYEGMTKFGQDYDAETVCLPINYRCVPDILDPAARLITHNQERISKPIKAHRESNGLPPAVRYFANRPEEAHETALALAASPDPGQWAVLGRTNALLDLVEAELFARKIPYQRKGGSSVWKTPAGASLCGLLHCVVHQDAGTALQALAWVGCPHELLASIAEHPNETLPPPLSDAIQQVTERQDEQLSGMLAPLKSLHKLYPQWLDQTEAGRYNLTIQGVAAWLSSYSNNRDDALITCCADVLCRMSAPLAQRLHLTTIKNDQDGAGVSLLTMHSAKGLEFDRVWIIGAEQGVIPHVDSPVDEERRLFYVAMTRARNHLHISYALGDDVLPSQFLRELGS